MGPEIHVTETLMYGIKNRCLSYSSAWLPNNWSLKSDHWVVHIKDWTTKNSNTNQQQHTTIYKTKTKNIKHMQTDLKSSSANK